MKVTAFDHGDSFFKRCCLSIALLGLLFFVQHVNAALELHYKFDETDWTASPPIIDYSGNGHSGSVFSASNPTQESSGKMCKAANFAADTLFHFDVQAVDTGLDIDSDIGDAGTIAFWYQLNSDSPIFNRELFDATRYSPPFTVYSFYLERDTSGRILFHADDSSNNEQTVSSATGVASVGSWVHIGVTWDFSNQSIKLYIDGALVDTEMGMNTSIANVSDLYIGDSNTVVSGYGTSANGLIDDFRIYSHVLTQTEVNELAGLSDPCASLSGCGAFFESGAQLHGSGGAIDFKNGAYVSGDPDGILGASTIQKSNGSKVDSCEFVDCSAGTETSGFTLPTFKTTTATNNVTVASGGTLTIGNDGTSEFNVISVASSGLLNFSAAESQYIINELSIGSAATVNLTPGDYWVDTLSLNTSAVINVVGSGTVRLYVKNSFTFGTNTLVNSPSLGQEGNPEQLLIIAYGNMKQNNDSTVSAVVYVENTFTSNSDGFLFGALSANDIQLGTGFQLHYDREVLLSVDFNDVCTGGSTGPALGGFTISTSNDGLYCLDHTITINVLDENGAAMTDFADTIVLDTQSGTGAWSLNVGSGTLIDSDTSDGLATYQFNASDGGTAEFSLSYREGNSVINVDTYLQSDGTLRDDDSEGDITFAPSGLLLTNSEISALDPSIYTIFNTHQTAETDFILHVTAYGQTPGDATCGIIETYTGNHNVQFWSDYADPVTGSRQVTISGNSIATTEGTASNQVVSFTGGKAALTVNYADAGEIQLHAKDSSSYSNILLGSTNPFVVRPATLLVTAVDNPGAADENGTAYRRAGEDFTVTVQAVGSASTPLTNFGVTTSTGITVSLSASALIGPPGGTLSSLNGANLGESDLTGTATISGNFNWPQVGIIQLSATLQDYLGSGDVIGTSTNVGRFIPYYYSITNPVVQNQSCNLGATAFNYMGDGKTLSFDVTAVDQLGNQLVNYTGNYASLDLSNSANFNLTAIDSGSNNLTSRLSNISSSGAWSTGIANVNLNYQMDKATSEDGPFTLQESVMISETQDALTVATYPTDLNADTDGNGSNDAVLLDNGIWRYGRLWMNNDYGSELYPITLNLTAQYWNGAAFVTNTDDHSCSNVAFSQFSSATGVISATDLESACFNTSPASTLTNSGSINYVIEKAKADCSVTAQGPGKTGSIVFEVDGPDYLRYDYHGNGDEEVSAQVNFGIYEGSKPVIFIQEGFR